MHPCYPRRERSCLCLASIIFLCGCDISTMTPPSTTTWSITTQSNLWRPVDIKSHIVLGAVSDEGYARDETAAELIARGILVSLIGPQESFKLKLRSIRLEGDVWNLKFEPTDIDTLGGGANIKIDRISGCLNHIILHK